MTYEAIVYHCQDFDGRIYVNVLCREGVQSMRVVLFKDGMVSATKESIWTFVMFKRNDSGSYQATVELLMNGGAIVTLESNVITVGKPVMAQVAYPPAPDIKGLHCIYDNVSRHYLELKLKKDCLGQLQSEPEAVFPKAYAVLQKEVLIKLSLKACWQEEDDLEEDEKNCDRYIINGDIADDEIIAIAQELETRDYVMCCTVVPDTTGMAPPELPLAEIADGQSAPFHDASSEMQDTIRVTSSTPDFSNLQTYMRPGAGMNVLAAWEAGHTGCSATVRLMDFGVYRNHENLVGNITVVNSRPETEDCNHGTASAGCIAASHGNGFGINGIAYDCRFFFYDTGDLRRVVEQANPGDIVLINIQFRVNGEYIPVIDNQTWWTGVRTLSNRGVTVILAAGNGGLNFSTEARTRHKLNDSGAMLAGAAYHNTGMRVGFSNHSHRLSFINSWGDWSVVTTGYSDLFREGNNRSYTRTYSGTSSATPLCGGALALVQSYAIRTGVFLSPAEFRSLLQRTGYTEGLDNGIGRRPNVMAAINALAEDRNSVLPPPPGGSYRIHTRQQFARLESDVAGTYLHQQLQTFTRIDIAAGDGAHAPRIVFPDASRIAAGREISFATTAGWDVILVVNGAEVRMRRGDSIRYFANNNTWVVPGIYQLNTREQFARLENDAAGTYLHQQLQIFTRIEITARDGAHAPRVVFPDASRIAAGREISFATTAGWDVVLVVNGSEVRMRRGDSIHYVSNNNRWVVPGIYQLNTREQFARLENDAAGAYLHQQLQTFTRIDIAAGDGVHVPRVVFPDASRIAAGREINFATTASWDVILVVNGQNLTIRNGQTMRFFVENNRWRQ